MVRTPSGHLPSPPMVAAHLFPEPAAGEPYTILIMIAVFYVDSFHSISIGTLKNLHFEPAGVRDSESYLKMSLEEAEMSTQIRPIYSTIDIEQCTVFSNPRSSSLLALWLQKAAESARSLYTKVCVYLGLFAQC
jgi:hypothetical protein